MAKKPKKGKKVRVEFRRNIHKRKREDWTRKYYQQGEEADTAPERETVQAKGGLTRRRTVVVGEDEDPELASLGRRLTAQCQLGRVLSLVGHTAMVQGDDGQQYRCAVSRVLRNLLIEERHPVVPGDQVRFRLVTDAISGPDVREPQGMIESVEPRRSELSRKYRNKEQVIAANVDQVLIVSALAQPPTKLNLVDRMIAAAEKSQVKPVLCFNKADLVDPADFQPLLGSYAQLGYAVVLTSAEKGLGLETLKGLLQGRVTVLAGQSGVGKSSLLNALQPGLGLKVREVSRSTLHGRHTTTQAQLFHLEFGAWVVDTPGIRQFELWDVSPEEVEGFFVEFRPFVPFCKFHNCMHDAEQGCAVKDAVARGLISPGRYKRYLNLYKAEEQEEEEEGW